MNNKSRIISRIALAFLIVTITPALFGIKCHAGVMSDVFNGYSELKEKATNTALKKEIVRKIDDELLDTAYNHIPPLVLINDYGEEYNESTPGLDEWGDILEQQIMDTGIDILKGKLSKSDVTSKGALAKDVSHLGYDVKELLALSDYHGVDKWLQCVVKGYNLGSDLISFLGDGAGLSFASGTWGLAGAYGGSILDSQLYADYLADKETPKEFWNSFWADTLDGIVDSLADVPNEVKPLILKAIDRIQQKRFEKAVKEAEKNGHQVFSFLNIDGTTSNVYFENGKSIEVRPQNIFEKIQSYVDERRAAKEKERIDKLLASWNDSIVPALEIQKHAREKSSINSTYTITVYDPNGAHLEETYGWDINDFNIEYVE